MIYKVLFMKHRTLQESCYIFTEKSDKKAIKYCERKWPARLRPNAKISLWYLCRKNEEATFDHRQKEWTEIRDWVLGTTGETGKNTE